MKMFNNLQPYRKNQTLATSFLREFSKINYKSITTITNICPVMRQCKSYCLVTVGNRKSKQASIMQKSWRLTDKLKKDNGCLKEKEAAGRRK